MKMSAFRELIRPCITALFACAFVAGFFIGKIPQDAFIPLAGMVIGFWFQSRSDKVS
jgi:hypothetical protein